MDDEQWIGEDSLDALLRNAAPETTQVNTEIEEELARIVVRSRVDTREARPPRRMRGVAAISFAAVVALGGAGAAAASTVDEWAWWAQDPTGTLTYTLPSGKECEQRLGDVNSTIPELTTAARDYLGSMDVFQAIDIDEEFALAKKEAQRYADNPAAQVGDPFVMPSDDELYETALFFGISKALTEEMERSGFSRRIIGDAGLELSGQNRCAEASE